MPLIPYAAFLTGALLSLLLPAAALIALAVWYWVFSARVPETTEDSNIGATPPAADGALSHPSEQTAAAQDR